MARRHGRRLLALLTILAVVACTGDRSAGPTSTLPVPSSTTTSTAPTASSSTTTTVATTTTTKVATTTTTNVATTTTAAASTTTLDMNSLENDIEVTVPSGDGPFPAVVLVHGGGWVAGDPSIMRPLANHLSDNGFLTLNTSYQLSTLSDPGFPGAIDDVACAVRLAATHQSSDGTVAVVGHSAGAHIGAVVALAGDGYGAGCPAPEPGTPERFIGLAGPYDVSRLGVAMQVFFGASQDAEPELWAAGNPQGLTGENLELDSLIMYGEFDGFVDDTFAFDFSNALEESGSSSLLERVEGARHNQMHDPDLVGDLIVTWLDR